MRIPAKIGSSGGVLDLTNRQEVIPNGTSFTANVAQTFTLPSNTKYFWQSSSYYTSNDNNCYTSSTLYDFENGKKMNITTRFKTTSPSSPVFTVSQTDWDKANYEYFNVNGNTLTVKLTLAAKGIGYAYY